MHGARAFVAGPHQHHPLTILDRPAAFAIYMWLVGGEGDEEFFTLPAPVTNATFCGEGDMRDPSWRLRWRAP